MARRDTPQKGMKSLKKNISDAKDELAVTFQNWNRTKSNKPPMTANGLARESCLIASK